MNCPKCGCELTEGNLYCEKCGEEIRIVPDFEPEIEQEMNETLSTLFAELAKDDNMTVEKQKEIMQRELDKIEKEEEPARVLKEKKRRQVISVILCCLFILGVCAGSSYLYRTYSTSYQIEKAKEYAAAEKYTQAITYLERARELNKEDGEILFQMADYYYIQEKYDLAVSALGEIIAAQESYPLTDVESAYDKTISIYRLQEKYEEINELLLACTNDSIVTTFQSYIAKPPEFSYVEGSYEEVLPLKLSANTSGKIYYTLDGSVPDENSEIYTAPIFLETGIYTVNAYFVNDYGIKSAMASSTYRIDLIVPAAPEVSVYSGDYFEPYMIEAEAPEDCSIYYTIDSTDPTTDSILYTGAISMPLGKSVYKFIAVSPEGVSSDITIRTYKLTLNTEITVDMAISNVVQALIGADVLLDAQGSLRGMNGHNVYKYSSVLRIDGYGDYYVIYEYYEDATGIQTRTDLIYGVSINDGSAHRITYDDEGKIVLADI